ncbi:acyl-CoA dehydratase activase-related protein [Barnesiella intestinihominis]|uniref:acyl-CoA dehydratase activase-related protein n=1 Tax=Barnesiella intestinihominis TaxID=487174 RepID=UPI003A8F0047
MQGEKQYKTGLDVGSTTAKIVIIDESGQTVFSRYERHNAQVNDLLSAYFREARQELGNIETSIAVTGSVGMGTAEQLRTEFIQEVVAATRYAQQLYPSASALIDIGGEDAKVVLFQGNHIDLRMNGNCAGGTGAFIDQMAVLLGVDIEELSRLALQESDFILPASGNLLPALGCALCATEEKAVSLSTLENLISRSTNITTKNSLPPLFDSETDYDNWKKEKAHYNWPSAPLVQGIQEAVLGIDSGSTTTKIVVTTPDGAILFSYYAPNLGNPIEAVRKGLTELKTQCDKNGTVLNITGSCSTGYGEELIKAAFGLDGSMIETMAHYRAARQMAPDVSFILDIGGQDMKAIFVKQGAITRMELNEACSSGCGSFIETFARTLKYNVSDFARSACMALHPCDLGTRCTVFMNSKIKQVLREGATVADIAAGLSYSVVKNCLYKVLKLKDGKELGGTMHNDAIVRAFELETGKKVVRSNLPELMGAYGCALLAASQKSNSRTINQLLETTGYTSRQIQCNGCENKCFVCRYTFPNGNTFFSGNKCERIFTNRGESEKPGQNIYTDKYALLFDRETSETGNRTIGIPRVLNMYENYPFWHALFTRCGIRVVLSDISTFVSYEKALNSVMSDNICFPAKLVHSHVQNLIHKKVERIFLPYVVYEHESDKKMNNSYNCPIVTGYSDVIRSSMSPDIPVDSPAITFADTGLLTKQCTNYLSSWGISKRDAEQAVKYALNAQKQYSSDIRRKAENIVRESRRKEEPIILLAGRPYHTDPLIQHKLSEMIANLGVNVISDDIVRDNSEIETQDTYLIKQWAYMNRILKAAEWTARQGNDIQFVQMTSFGCGPDAFLLDEVRDILHRNGKPFTLLKIDDVNNIGSLKLRVRSLVESLKQTPLRGTTEKFRTTEVFRKKDRNRKIIAPFMSEYITPLLKPIFKLSGYDIEVLPPSDASSAETGLKYANNEVCYPATLIVGDIINALESGKYDLNNTAVAITQTGGQCRATNYLALIKRAMLDAGFGNVPVVTLGLGRKVSNEQEGFELKWQKVLPIALNALLYTDTLSKFYHASVVREKERGAVARLRDKYLNLAERPILENEPHKLVEYIHLAAREFNDICMDKTCPKIGVVGEIFLKFNSYAHQHVVRFLCEQGIEVAPPILLPFFMQGFVNRENKEKLLLEKKCIPHFLSDLFYRYIDKRIALFNRTASTFRYFTPFTDIYEKAEETKNIVSGAAQFGEGWLLPAEIIAFTKQGINNVISLQPFGCIANHIVSKGIEKKLRMLYPELNLLSLDFDSGVSSVNVTNRLLLFTHNLSA